jgi:nucleotide-binding universal stress UspA family protein
MNHLQAESVVVGVDGSHAAVSAAKWAVDEAISRQLPLRLVHVVGRKEAQSESASTQPSDWELEIGEIALYQAEVAVQDVGRPVEVETVLLSGDPEQVLINESQDAALVCVGTDRRGWAADILLGTTEAALATRAHCPVAIIRTNPDGTATEPGVIAVVLNDEPDNDQVVHYAIEEGRRRNATVQVVAAGTGVKPSENHSSAIELAVVGRADADQIAELATPNCHPIVGYPDCSVVVIRD